MFLRSKVQEMILRRRSRSMSGAQHAGNPSTAPCVEDGGKAHAPSFASPRLLHSASLPAGAGSPMRDSVAMAYSLSPTSVLVASAAFLVAGADRGGGSGSSGSSKRRPWCDGCAGPHGLADALDCAHDGQERRRSILAGRVKAQAPALARSCSLDRRVEFGVKNKSSWLPLRTGSRTEQEEAAPAPEETEMEPSSEDYTCVISRGPNPRTVHIFGDRVVEGDHRESSAWHINLPVDTQAS
ncbi:uncharacterized protein LOC124700579 [Lolium rigidum]|uniref:uncharacterized protein LOC124700579 n=1 Tax=Lolium rigidum TaxID=89674 RepID=UPI001F5D5BBF|nr:uncharacterized protein LOC124700579 [Lolium rigidum]